VPKHPYDPGRAKALLDEAGWTVGGDGVRAKDGQRLRAVGVDLRIERVEPGLRRGACDWPVVDRGEVVLRGGGGGGGGRADFRLDIV
jgi:hypothetical protein